ncbi:MAG: hypothetical protein EA422_05910 [Gemmatimonadales bacterium]|nr:MAG: hypothetical protein EA422_05910 [Gemmatimonadales bacterium]
MNFFEVQDEARGLSRKLVALYVLAVVGLVLGVYLVAAVALGVAGASAEPGVTPGPASPARLFDPGLFVLVTLGMGVLIGGGTAFRTSQLRKGGAAVAELLGGRRVDPGTRDPKERQLMNVVEEMSIASGVPVPEVFIMDREPGINAFAAGHTLNDAAVAVTRGALDAFTRDELQGVMAHEFSHILNGDMRLNIRLMGLLFGILLLTVVGRGVLRGGMGSGRGRSSGGGGQAGAIAAVGIALVVLGYLGVLVGRLIQAAVSRQREYLADAAAVEFTRNPDGIANALKRIGAGAHGSRLQDSHAEEASHFFFASGRRKALSGMTATHPPLEKRIRRVQPTWDGSYDVPPAPKVRGSGRKASRPSRRDPIRDLMEGRESGAAGGLPGAMILGGILASAGTLGPGQVAEARRILGALPDEIRSQVRTPEGALGTVVGLVLAGVERPEGEGKEGDPAEVVGRRLGNRVLRGSDDVMTWASSAPRELRLPLLELALPGLRGLPAERARALRDTLSELLERGRGGSVDPFLFALFHLVRRNLPVEVEGEPGGRRGGGKGLDGLTEPAGILLSLLAHAGGRAPEAAADAFSAGAARLPGGGGRGGLTSAGDLGLGMVDASLTALEMAAPGAKRGFLEAAAAVVEWDGRVGPEEAELLRALGEALEVPLPPLGSIASTTDGEANG